MRVWFVILFFATSGCSGKALDGGSADAGSSDASSADASSSEASSPTAGQFPTTPLAGSIKGHPFAFVSGDLRKQGDHVFLTLRNYDWRCGGPPGPADALLINIGDPPQAAGTFELRYGDGHGASFQAGISQDASATPVSSVSTGLVRLDMWTLTPGETLTGAAMLESDDSHVAGTFTVTVCPPRP